MKKSYYSDIQRKQKKPLLEYYNRNIPDIDEIGEFVFYWDFDEDEYAEYLEDNELQDSYESKNSFAMECGEFNIEFMDAEYFHSIGMATMTYDEITDSFGEFGESLANYVVNTCLKNDNGRIEKSELLSFDNFDVNNPDELNAVAVKLLQNGPYFIGCRGFILTNGVIVYTPSEHNKSSIIPGVKGTVDFIKKGNIRVTLDGLDICKPPTKQQLRTIVNIVRYFAGKTLYVTYVNMTGGEQYQTFYDPNAENVLSKICKFFFLFESAKTQKIRHNKNKHKTMQLLENNIYKIIRNSIKQNIKRL